MVGPERFELSGPTILRISAERFAKSKVCGVSENVSTRRGIHGGLGVKVTPSKAGHGSACRGLSSGMTGRKATGVMICTRRTESRPVASPRLQLPCISVNNVLRDFVTRRRRVGGRRTDTNLVYQETTSSKLNGPSMVGRCPHRPFTATCRELTWRGRIAFLEFPQRFTHEAGTCRACRHRSRSGHRRLIGSRHSAVGH
jgi:hypothetical protein